MDKLTGFGLIKTDIKGIRPFSKSEAARLVLDAEKNIIGFSGLSEPLFAKVRNQLLSEQEESMILRIKKSL